MLRENLAQKSFKFVFRDVIGDILYWPIWWYSAGLARAGMRMVNSVSHGNQVLGVSLWAKNLFRPMFGQYDWQGRLISFFVRFFQIIFRTIALLLWLIVSVIVFLLWIIIPLFLIAQILLNLGLFGNKLWQILPN